MAIAPYLMKLERGYMYHWNQHFKAYHLICIKVAFYQGITGRAQILKILISIVRPGMLDVGIGSNVQKPMWHG